MRADALGQFLLYKRWARWFFVHGRRPDDLDYVAAVRRAASRFGAKIVAERNYTYDARTRNTDTGHQQTEQQMALLTQSVPDYDVIFVVDEDEAFGDYLLFNALIPIRSSERRAWSQSLGIRPLRSFRARKCSGAFCVFPIG